MVNKDTACIWYPPATTGCAFEAMVQMTTLDIAAIEAALRG